jgi:hypothetical protein
MPQANKKFAYYKRLSAADKKIYDKSDAIKYVKIPDPSIFQPVLKELESALERGDKQRVELASQKFVNGLCDLYQIPRMTMRVLETRPSKSWGELHGLYEEKSASRTLLTVWMMTAKKEQVVAFRTFVRTIVHEYLHHLDFKFLKLADSFHTQGFYQRESSVIKVLLGE